MPNYSAQSIIDRESLDLFSQQRRDPMVLCGAFLEVTRNLYLHGKHLYPTIRPWDPYDAPESTFIEAFYIWDDENNNRRPAIIVHIEDMQYDTDKVQGIGSKAGMNMKEGIYEYARRVTGAVTWVHLGRTRGQVLQYGCNTLDLLDAFSDIIQRDFCFEKFEVRAILKPKQRKDRPKEFECHVRADFQLQENFQIKFESPKLKTLRTVKQTTVGC